MTITKYEMISKQTKHFDNVKMKGIMWFLTCKLKKKILFWKVLRNEEKNFQETLHFLLKFTNFPPLFMIPWIFFVCNPHVSQNIPLLFTFLRKKLCCFMLFFVFLFDEILLWYASLPKTTTWKEKKIYDLIFWCKLLFVDGIYQDHDKKKCFNQ